MRHFQNGLSVSTGIKLLLSSSSLGITMLFFLITLYLNQRRVKEKLRFHRYELILFFIELLLCNAALLTFLTQLTIPFNA
jgi:hypothetical protein